MLTEIISLLVSSNTVRHNVNQTSVILADNKWLRTQSTLLSILKKG